MDDKAKSIKSTGIPSPASQGAGMAKAVLPELKTMPSTSSTRSSSAENHSELGGGGSGASISHSLRAS